MDIAELGNSLRATKITIQSLKELKSHLGLCFFRPKSKFYAYRFHKSFTKRQEAQDYV